MFYYLNNFLLYSIFGYIFETIINLIIKGDFTANPFTGPWMPVYGFGIVIMIFLTRLIFNRFKMPRYAKIMTLFLSTVIILTILELAGGLLTEAILHKSFWDYTNMKFNYGKYICLEVSLVWGIMCLIFLYLLKPLTDKVIKKIPKIISIIVTLAIFTDFIYSFFIK